MGRRVVHDMPPFGLSPPTTPSRRDRPASLEAPWVPMRAVDPTSRFVAYLHQEAVDALVEAARTSDHGDSIGWLFGRGFLDADGPYSFVRRVVTASAPQRGPASLRMSPSDDEHYSRLTRTTYPHLDPMGWWRSANDPSAAGPTEDDHDSHRRWCTAGHQLGLRAVHDGSATVILGLQGPNAVPLTQLHFDLDGVAPPRAMVVGSPVKRSQKRVMARPSVRTSDTKRSRGWRKAYKALREFLGGLMGFRDE